MDLVKISTNLRPAIELEIQRVINENIPAEFIGTRSILTYHLGWEGEGAGLEAQGKRIRPLLVLLCAASACGQWQQALPAAAAVELVHNFSLIHDDIEDRSVLRRGRSTVWVKWGIPQAINAGDLMYTLAFTAVLDMSRTVSPAVGLRSAEVLNKTCIRLTGGQYLDMKYEKQAEVTIDEYWPMIEGKTASLLECCAVLGGLAGQVEEAQLNSFLEFGHNLGLAFQILDDWLGIWGDAIQIGKSTESDLVSGKKTLPVLFGLRQKGQFYRRWIKGNITPDESHELAIVLREEGAQQYTQAMADQFTQKALDALSSAAREENEASASLRQLALELLSRKQ
ncbi:MAG TPA: polyprenyl synthetase family protein [Anaerolineaceae bacterium]|nr:polyprenyl synthetase family protein [Anaerolineaceae bacterium]